MPEGDPESDRESAVWCLQQEGGLTRAFANKIVDRCMAVASEDGGLIFGHFLPTQYAVSWVTSTIEDMLL
jgi:hypothetical protein